MVRLLLLLNLHHMFEWLRYKEVTVEISLKKGNGWMCWRATTWYLPTDVVKKGANKLSADWPGAWCCDVVDKIYLVFIKLWWSRSDYCIWARTTSTHSDTHWHTQTHTNTHWHAQTHSDSRSCSPEFAGSNNPTAISPGSTNSSFSSFS